jgi:hypothetical protein
MFLVLFYAGCIFYKTPLMGAGFWCWGCVCSFLNTPLRIFFFSFFVITIICGFVVPPGFSVWDRYVDPFLNWGLDDYKKNKSKYL